MSLWASLPNVYIRPLFRNANTDFIQVSALNQTDEPQTVTIAVQNYQDTCDGDIYPSYGYLCGELINEGGSDIEVCNGNESGCIYCEPEGINQFVGPATFTIPPRQLYSVRVFIPADPLIPVEPIYVVWVSFSVDPSRPSDPFYPTAPGHPVTINTWGIQAWFSKVIRFWTGSLRGFQANFFNIIKQEPSN